MNRSKTLNALLILSFLALPAVASSESPSHGLRTQARQAAIVTTGNSWDPLTPVGQHSRLLMTPILYTARVEAPGLSALDGSDESSSGRGIWVQVAAGCGLLLFGALRRLAGL